jgi:hypothetical protein
LKFKAFFLFLFFVCFYSKNAFSQSKIQQTVDSKCLNIHSIWLKESFTLTKNSVGFSAPISARAYAYFSIGMYESCVENSQILQSLTGQLNGFNRLTWKEKDKQYNWSLISNMVDFQMVSYLYRTMPPANLKRITEVKDSIIKIESKKLPQKTIEISLEYAMKLSKEIIDWSKLDGADEAFKNNYPLDYSAPQCPSCWTKTTPGYQPALLPYWGKTRSIIPNSEVAVKEIQLIPFSKDTNSALYKDAMGIIEVTKSNNPIYEQIAEYWDDAPGYTGTPSGHFFNLTRELVAQQNSTLDKAMEVYVKLGIALNEAFINCWRLKYIYNFIRPITYIHRFIDPQFNSLIASPSFPEFPSGHSFQSGAGSEVLKSIFTDNIAFIDSTNVSRTDIDGSPKTFSSFSQMAEEISISRYYGGIHFKQSLDISLDFGKKIGVYVVKGLKCRK